MGATTVGVAVVSSAATTAAVSATNTSMNAEGDMFKQSADISKQTAKDTTSKESLENMAIAGTTAALTFGITQGVSELTNSANAANTTSAANGSNGINSATQISAIDPNLTTLNLDGFPATSLASSGINNSTTLTSRFLTALQNSSIQTISASAAQSTIKGDSFSEAFKNQLTNIIINAAGEIVANEIGTSYKTGEINKTTQLTAHAALGCAMAAAGSNNCAAGAASGVIGETFGELMYYNGNGLNKQNTIAVSQVIGALTAAAIVGPDDGDSVFAGSQIGRNAVENNTLYINKETQEIIATDKENDHKIILVDEKESNNIKNQNKLLLFNDRFSEQLIVEDSAAYYSNTNITFENYMNDDELTQKYFTGPNNSVAVVSADYQNETNGQLYNLTNREDFYQLSLLTGLSGLEYSRQVSNILFNDYNDITNSNMNYANLNNLLNTNNNPLLHFTNNYNNNQLNTNMTPNNKTNIFFQNGMDNNFQTSLASANLVSALTGRPVGLIVNNTANITNDIYEYLPTELVLRDALNSEIYQRLDNYNLARNQNSLILTHSAGNNDIMKASQTLQLTNTALNNTINVMSIGSPISYNKLNEQLLPSGISLLGQYNNWKDPVTHSKVWGTVAVGSLAVGLTTGVIYGTTTGVSIGANMAATGTGLEALFTGVIGGAVGGAPAATGYSLLKLQHPFEKYYNNNFNNLKTDIKNWAEQNPVR